jgi:hypothetical protein
VGCARLWPTGWGKCRRIRGALDRQWARTRCLELLESARALDVEAILRTDPYLVSRVAGPDLVGWYRFRDDRVRSDDRTLVHAHAGQDSHAGAEPYVVLENDTQPSVIRRLRSYWSVTRARVIGTNERAELRDQAVGPDRDVSARRCSKIVVLTDPGPGADGYGAVTVGLISKRQDGTIADGRVLRRAQTGCGVCDELYGVGDPDAREISARQVEAHLPKAELAENTTDLGMPQESYRAEPACHLSEGHVTDGIIPWRPWNPGWGAGPGA